MIGLLDYRFANKVSLTHWHIRGEDLTVLLGSSGNIKNSVLNTVSTGLSVEARVPTINHVEF